MVLEQGGADLRPLQIGQDAQRLALLFAYLANLLDDGDLSFVRAVGKVQADNVDAGPDHRPDHSFGVRRRSERGHNFGAALRWRLLTRKIGKRHQGSSESGSK